MSASILDSRSFSTSTNTSMSNSFAPSRARLWTGRVMYGIIAILLAMDTGMKLAMAPQAIQGSAPLGFTPQHVFIIGWIGLVCLVTYLIPRTRILGTVLWTAYFGGTVVTHLRVGNPLFTHILSGVYLCTVMWISLYLFDPRVAPMIGPVRPRN
jgi:hypothetical protein